MKENSKITKFIKYELSGWNYFEIFSLIFIFIIIIFDCIFLNDNKISVISAICGILYTMIAGKGKISCYAFGLCGSGCYGYLAFQNGLFGNLLLYVCYYIPMQILGIFKWKKNLAKDTHAIIKSQLILKEQFILIFSSIIAILIVSYSLNLSGDSQPVVDGITTVLSVVGMFLTVKRCVEQWIVWMIVNGLSFFMWIKVLLNGNKAYATLIMWGFYFILAIYFYIIWKKELNQLKK